MNLLVRFASERQALQLLVLGLLIIIIIIFFLTLPICLNTENLLSFRSWSNTCPQNVRNRRRRGGCRGIAKTTCGVGPPTRDRSRPHVWRHAGQDRQAAARVATGDSHGDTRADIDSVVYASGIIFHVPEPLPFLSRVRVCGAAEQEMNNNRARCRPSAIW